MKRNRKTMEDIRSICDLRIAIKLIECIEVEYDKCKKDGAIPQSITIGRDYAEKYKKWITVIVNDCVELDRMIKEHHDKIVIHEEKKNDETLHTITVSMNERNRLEEEITDRIQQVFNEIDRDLGELKVMGENPMFDLCVKMLMSIERFITRYFESDSIPVRCPTERVN